MRIEVLTAMKMLMMVVKSCGLLVRYQHFEENIAYIFMAEDRGGIFFQNITIYL
jgi:hypothetical protein